MLFSGSLLSIVLDPEGGPCGGYCISIVRSTSPLSGHIPEKIMDPEIVPASDATGPSVLSSSHPVKKINRDKKIVM